MDPFAIVLLGVVAAGVLGLWLLGRHYPGSGLEQIGQRSARQITEDREALEAEDLSQMLAAHNERRRRRGQAEMTVADLERRVLDDFNDQRRRRDAYLADRELDELLEVTNARRRARRARANPGGRAGGVRRRARSQSPGALTRAWRAA